jgi:hypothetical protein
MKIFFTTKSLQKYIIQEAGNVNNHKVFYRKHPFWYIAWVQQIPDFI